MVLKTAQYKGGAMARVRREKFSKHLRTSTGLVAILAVIAASAAWVLLADGTKHTEFIAASQSALRGPTGYAQLVSNEPLPGTEGPFCEGVPASPPTTLMAAIRQEQMAAGMAGMSSADARPAEVFDRPPLRVIRDTYPTYSAVAVDYK